MAAIGVVAEAEATADAMWATGRSIAARVIAGTGFGVTPTEAVTGLTGAATTGVIGTALGGCMLASAVGAAL